MALWSVVMMNGQTREVEAAEVDVGPAGELRFTYEAIREGMFRDSTMILAPGVWYEAVEVIEEELDPSEGIGSGMKSTEDHVP